MTHFEIIGYVFLALLALIGFHIVMKELFIRWYYNHVEGRRLAVRNKRPRDL